MAPLVGGVWDYGLRAGWAVSLSLTLPLVGIVLSAGGLSVTQLSRSGFGRLSMVWLVI